MSKAALAPMAVLGAGSWGTALAFVLAKNGIPVHLWDRNPELLSQIRATGQNAKYMPGLPFANTIVCFDDINAALQDTSNILIVVPSHGFLEILLKIKPLIKHQGIIWATKGLDPNTGEFLSQTVQRELGTRASAVLSGPSFAKEVALGLPTAVTIAATEEEYGYALAETFRTETFRSYISLDLIGVQLGGVIKNVLAVAAGISDGLHFGSNARAALITRGLSEMMRLGMALGAKKETLMGLSGCGDMILTCTDNQSRNRRFGLALAEGMTEAQALQKVGQVVEAVYNVEQLCHLANEQDVELPISEQVLHVVKHGVSPREAVTKLFARSLKNE